jgi:catechol 2,3-dioxygenase-like lactoylglutathione lyase family enzyme
LLEHLMAARLAAQGGPDMVRLEHANLLVRDVEEMIRFVRTAFPDFRVRGRGTTWQGAPWVHVGTDDTYLALTQATQEPVERWIPYAGKPGVNHLAYEVDDVEGVRRRLAAAGYADSTVPNRHPHRRRVYFHDAEGNDWEFVQYLSQDPAERNDYALPDIA